MSKTKSVVPKKVKVLPPGTCAKINREAAEGRIKNLENVKTACQKIRQLTWTVESGLTTPINEQKAILNILDKKKPHVSYKSGDKSQC